MPHLPYSASLSAECALPSKTRGNTTRGRDRAARTGTEKHRKDEIMQARQMRGGGGETERKRTVLVWSGFMMPRRRGSDEITRLHNAAQSRSCEDAGALCRVNPRGPPDCVRDFSFARPDIGNAKDPTSMLLGGSWSRAFIAIMYAE